MVLLSIMVTIKKNLSEMYIPVKDTWKSKDPSSNCLQCYQYHYSVISIIIITDYVYYDFYYYYYYCY